MNKDILTIDIDFSNIKSEADFFEVICRSLEMPKCNEGNWPALRDMLSDLEVHSDILKSISNLPKEIHLIINGFYHLDKILDKDIIINGSNYNAMKCFAHTLMFLTDNSESFKKEFKFTFEVVHGDSWIIK